MILFQTTFPTPKSFWDFNVGNLLTWIVVAVGFFWSRIQDVWRAKERIQQLEDSRISPERVKQLEEWKTAHEWEAKAHDQSMRKLELLCTRLTTLAETSERRLQLLEERPQQWDGRDRRESTR